MARDSARSDRPFVQFPDDLFDVFVDKQPSSADKPASPVEAPEEGPTGPAPGDTDEMPSHVVEPTPAPPNVIDAISESENRDPFAGTKFEDVFRRRLNLKYFDQDLSLIPAEVAFVGHYLGVRQIGPAADFDRKLIRYSQEMSSVDASRSRRRRSRRGWCESTRSSSLISLEKLIELGIVIGNLGTLNLLPIPEGMHAIAEDERRIVPKNLILGGFGEPGQMNRENVRFVFTNVVYAMKALGARTLSTSLIGTLRRILNTQQSIRAIIEGIEEGMRRFDVKDIELRISFNGESQGRIVRNTLNAIAESRRENDRILFAVAEVPEPERRSAPSIPAGLPTEFEEPEFDTDRTHITVTSANAEEFPIQSMRDAGSQSPSPASPVRNRILKFSALSTTSIIPVRRVQVQDYFAKLLPSRVLECRDRHEQWQYGYLMMRCFIPEDFQRIIEESEKLTLVVDRETAQIPWEMAGYKLRSDERFFGADMEISRQFRSILGETNGHAPELNHALRMLIVADPASQRELALEHAKDEGYDVAKVIADARRAYGDYDEDDDDGTGRVDFRIFLRIGNVARDGEVRDDDRLVKLKEDYGDDIDIARCDPIEILKLMMNEDFDVVHYAGHGKFDPESGEMGWLLDGECFLSASDIFRVRRVPRLVFSNACHSGRMQENLTPQDALMRQVSMAEAFFSRGIENYVGTGWEVDDELARKLAVMFYRNVLGVRRDNDEEPAKTTEIRSIGAALKEARRAIVPRSFRRDSRQEQEEASDQAQHLRRITWGAYQHYGLGDARLIAPLPRRNDD